MRTLAFAGARLQSDKVVQQIGKALAVQLPNWRNPMVCDVNTAKMTLDNAPFYIQFKEFHCQKKAKHLKVDAAGLGNTAWRLLLGGR